MLEIATLTCCVPKHAARRLHDDLRLEFGGVLKSRAIVPGPYGAGVVLLWDQGVWMHEGDAAQGRGAGARAFTLHGAKLTGRWRLTRMKPRPREQSMVGLLAKSRDASALQPDEPDTLEKKSRSILTGLALEDIAQAAI